MGNNKQKNRELLKESLLKYPFTKFVYFRRTGKSFDDDIIDVPISQAESTIKQCPEWEFVGSVDEGVSTPTKKSTNEFTVPPLPAPISNKEFNMTMGNTTARKFVYIKNKEGRVFDIPASHLEATLKQPGMSLVSGEISDKKMEAPVVETNLLECPICSFVAKNKSGLKLHNRKHI